MKEIIYREVAGRIIVNVTPHDITFGTDDGGVVSVPCSGIIVSARATEKQVADDLVTTTFEKSKEEIKKIASIQKWYRKMFADSSKPLRIVGSIIAMNAYPGVICGMVPMKGFERVPPAQKRMDPHKFNVALG